MSEDFSQFSRWIGRMREFNEPIAPDRVAALAATLDLEKPPIPGEALPPAWHWIFFNETARASLLGPDGHPKRGGFLPPVPLPRRMWAGGRLKFPGVLRVGEAAIKRSEVMKVDVKDGRSGRLVFVQVNHRIGIGAAAAIEEEHDIVYREAPAPGAPAPKPTAAPGGAAWTRTIEPDPVLLFRYSALTANSHRIHYDWRYVTGEEGYPGLIVHGPLIATLLLELLRAHEPVRRVESFSFRAMSPLFAPDKFTVNGAPATDGRSVKLWAAGPQGDLAMDATATLAA